MTDDSQTFTIRLSEEQARRIRRDAIARISDTDSTGEGEFFAELVERIEKGLEEEEP